MKYRVVFRERSDRRGERADNPPSFLEPELDDETVLDAVFVGRTEPDALHSFDVMEEDDDFESLGSETWEYDVAEGKDDNFTGRAKELRHGDGVRASGVEQRVRHFLKLEREGSKLISANFVVATAV